MVLSYEIKTTFSVQSTVQFHVEIGTNIYEDVVETIYHIFPIDIFGDVEISCKFLA